MNARYRLPTPVLAALLMTTLGGCANSGTLPSPLRADPPAACEAILREVAPPQVRAGDDIRVVTAKGAVTIRTANSRIRAGRECVAGQRQAYGAR